MALTVNNFTGFETQGGEEASSTSGTPAYETTNQRTDGSALSLDALADEYVLPWVEDVTDAGTDYVFGFAFRKSGNPSGSSKIAQVLDDAGQNILLVDLNSSGVLTIEDANQANIDSGATLNNDQWYFIEVYAQLNNASANWEWFIDGTSQGSGSGADLTDGNGFGSSSSGVQFTGENSLTFLFDDAYILSGATAATDRLGGSTLASMPEVFAYQNDQLGTSPDGGLASVGTSGGDSLDAGTWGFCAETPLGTAAVSEYTASGAAGSVDLTGPSGDSNIDGDSNIKAIKGIWHLKRGNGGATTHYIGLGDSGDTDVADQTVTLNATFANFFELRETNLPTSSQFIRQGFGTSSARDIDCADMWAQLLHVPDTGGITLSPAGDQLTITGSTPTLTLTDNHFLTPAGEQLTITGSTPTLTHTRDHFFQAAGGQLVITGSTPGFTKTEGVTLSPAGDQLTITGSTPTLTQTFDHFLTPAGEQLIITGSTPTLTQTRNHFLTPAGEQLTISGSTPTLTVTRDHQFNPAGDQLTITGSTPTLTQTFDHFLTPANDNLIITGSTPTLTQTRDILLQPAGGQLVITGSTPTLTIAGAGDLTFSPAGAQLTITGSTPALTLTDNHLLSPAGAQLIISGSTPTLTIESTAKTFSPAGAQLVITGSTPTVTNTGAAGGWWPIELKRRRRRRVRYAPTGRKVLSWELEKDRFELDLQQLDEETALIDASRGKQKQFIIPEAGEAAVITPQTLPKPAYVPSITAEQVAPIIARIKDTTDTRLARQKAIEAAMERDDEEALIMILLEAA